MRKGFLMITVLACSIFLLPNVASAEGRRRTYRSGGWSITGTTATSNRAYKKRYRNQDRMPTRYRAKKGHRRTYRSGGWPITGTLGRNRAERKREEMKDKSDWEKAFRSIRDVIDPFMGYGGLRKIDPNNPQGKQGGTYRYRPYKKRWE